MGSGRGGGFLAATSDGRLQRGNKMGGRINTFNERLYSLLLTNFYCRKN